MNQEQVRQAVIAALSSIAPEGDYDRLRGDRPLRDQLDIDSFDLLRVIIRLHETLGVDIPEADYGQLTTLANITSYLSARVD